MTSRATFKDSRGFTFVELLIVIAIGLIIVSAVTPIYGNLQVSSQLTSSQDHLLQTLRVARERSIAGLNDSQHGVYLDIDPSGADSFTLYQGNDYATRDSAYDRVETLSVSVAISTTLAGSEVSFSKGIGLPSATGTVTLTHDVDGSRGLSINRLGAVEAD